MKKKNSKRVTSTFQTGPIRDKQKPSVCFDVATFQGNDDLAKLLLLRLLQAGIMMNEVKTDSHCMVSKPRGRDIFIHLYLSIIPSFPPGSGPSSECEQ